MVPVGYAFGSIDEMGDGAFRKVGDQPNQLSTHRFEVGGESRELGPGDLCHVESTTPRRLTSVGDEDLVLLVVGAKDGYVGRDGHLAEPGTY